MSFVTIYCNTNTKKREEVKKKNRAGLLQNADLRIFGNRSGNCDFIIIKCPFFFFQTSIYKVP